MDWLKQLLKAPAVLLAVGTLFANSVYADVQLNVNSIGITGVPISGGAYGGTTNYIKYNIPEGTEVTLTAPLTHNGWVFRDWTLYACTSTSGVKGSTCHLTLGIYNWALEVNYTLPVISDYFVTTWKTNNAGTSGPTSITVPMVGGPYDVDWDNDGTFDEFGLTGPVTHDFGSAGTYTIRIQGSHDSIRFQNGGDKLKLLSVDHWGLGEWTTMESAFWGASNMTVGATDTPNFSAVTNMRGMFQGASLANPDTSGWNTSKVTNMSHMFRDATSANPVISGWDTSKVTNMSYMFYNATSFNRDVGSWNVTALTNAELMFNGVSRSVANYDSLLIGWNAQSLQGGVSFHGGDSYYCSAPAVAARANMIASDFWTITDLGQACLPDSPTVAPDLTPETDTGESDTDNITFNKTPSFYVSCTGAGNTVSLYTNNPVVDSKVGVHVCAGTGTGTVTATTVLPNGVNNMAYTEESVVGESGHSPPLAITIVDVPGVPGDDFVTTWKTNNPGSTNFTSIRVPMVGGPYYVDWDNDGSFDEFGLYGRFEHDYGVVGTPTIRIRGDFEAINFYSNSGDREKILSVDQWGTNAWATMEGAFAYTPNLTVPATDIPDLSVLTSLRYMFLSASSANPDTSGWDTSNVTDMSGLFSGASSANPDTSGWDTSNVTDMSGLFSGTSPANPDTSGWDTSNVTDMSWMFGSVSSTPDTSGWDTSNVTDMSRMFFNYSGATPDTSGWDTSNVTDMSGMFIYYSGAAPDTSGWDTSSVTSMYRMFKDATSANPNTSGWDTSNVIYMGEMFTSAVSANPDTSNWNTSSVFSMDSMFADATSANPDTSGWNTASVSDMDFMFSNATSANPDTSGWDTSSVIYMNFMFWGAIAANPDVSKWNTASVSQMAEMFSGATSFDRNLGSWDVTSLLDATGMLDGVTLSTDNYDRLLIGWGAQGLASGVDFSGGNSNYCSPEAEAAREKMIVQDGWTITDGGKSCPTCNVKMVSSTMEYFEHAYEACEILVIGLDFLAVDGSIVTLSAGLEVEFAPGFLVETGATIETNVCGQSLCRQSPDPMPAGCHSCVDKICAVDAFCCDEAFDRGCLQKVDDVCGLVCEVE